MRQAVSPRGPRAKVRWGDKPASARSGGTESRPYGAGETGFAARGDRRTQPVGETLDHIGVLAETPVRKYLFSGIWATSVATRPTTDSMTP